MKSLLVISFLCIFYFLTPVNSNKKSWRKVGLEEHNKYRKKHGSPPLKQDCKIDSVAQKYAEKLAASGSFEHSQNSKYGENLAMQYSSAGNPDKVDIIKKSVAMWYNEVSNYDYNNPGFSMGTGHFTQVVWRGTKALGLGMAFKGNSVYIVGNYFPPGNMMGDFPANVKKS